MADFLKLVMLLLIILNLVSIDLKLGSIMKHYDIPSLDFKQVYPDKKDVN
jgi:hypothetical protein